MRSNFPGFYRGKALIAVELRKHISTGAESGESFTEFCRKMRALTGQGRKTVENILEEDYPNLTVVDDKVVPRE